ncbi:aldo/keto reductase [Nonomuraea maritima]|uniref:aldo/keto reductase n=1 Tax=Nonomuraea maritima TaxID=683260 RepID=UPI00371332E1
MHTPIPTRTLGDLRTGAIGLGAMPMSVAGHMPGEDRSVRTVLAALDAGVTLVDTADVYCPSPAEVGHNERLVARALSLWGGDAGSVLVATKGGHVRTPGGYEVDGSPAHLKRACDGSLKALGVDSIGLYQHHRPDPRVPYEESMGALKELHDAGKIQRVGISNADPAQIRLARSILGDRLVSVQNKYSPGFRSSEPEIDVCEELGLAFLPWSPLGGVGRTGSIAPVFAEVAAARGVSPQQICLAWELARSPVVIPIPGASRPETILDSVAAARLELDDDELARLNG